MMQTQVSHITQKELRMPRTEINKQRKQGEGQKKTLNINNKKK